MEEDKARRKHSNGRTSPGACSSTRCRRVGLSTDLRGKIPAGRKESSACRRRRKRGGCQERGALRAYYGEFGRKAALWRGRSGARLAQEPASSGLNEQVCQLFFLFEHEWVSLTERNYIAGKAHPPWEWQDRSKPRD